MNRQKYIIAAAALVVALAAAVLVSCTKGNYESLACKIEYHEESTEDSYSDLFDQNKAERFSNNNLGNGVIHELPSWRTTIDSLRRTEFIYLFDFENGKREICAENPTVAVYSFPGYGCFLQGQSAGWVLVAAKVGAFVVTNACCSDVK